MKPKIYLLAISLLGFIVAKANTDPDPTNPSKDKKKIDEVSGLIFDSDNKKPIKDVTITAYFSSKKEKAAQTDETGAFSFDELKPGTYKFVFEKAGYKRITKEKVVIKTDETFQMNIEMINSSDFELAPSPFHFSDF